MPVRQLPPTFYVSITGLRPKGWFGFLLFWRYAIPSKMQADTAPGVLHVDVKRINGVQHTLTAWTSKQAMKDYITQGAHLRAMKVFRRIATGKTFGYESDRIPNWDEVHELWKQQGVEY
jgi:hypothetical protein